MATGAAVAIVVGAGIKAYGQYKSAQEEAEAMKNQADAQEAESAEMMRRAYINAQATGREGKALEAKQLSSFVAGGVEITEGTPLTVLEDTNEKIARQISYDLQATGFTAEQKRRSAAFGRDAACATAKAGKIAAAATVVGGAGKAYGQYSASEGK